ncbi:helix-turn-helix domain-containing protein [Rhizobium sp. SL86]|uniref:helix-turn-helix domain-containing protein n=1 Tax=Rhizobium sp. SL86 TaxID=2995148 RepID=UPI002275CC7E|nr:helix-turn-helix domain-containing protein [Rhizobium sp. SL86]MCY1669038.1 helix-turn-helix domain-containing protein [Rhizobium sp. SL86]
MTKRIGVLLWDNVSLAEMADLAKCIEMVNKLAGQEIFSLTTFAKSRGAVSRIGTWLVCSAAYSLEEVPDDFEIILIPPAECLTPKASDADCVTFFASRNNVRRVCAWGNGVVFAAASGVTQGRRIACDPADVPAILSIDRRATIEPFADFCDAGFLWTWTSNNRAKNVVLALVGSEFGLPFAQELARRIGVFERMSQMVSGSRNSVRSSSMDKLKDWIEQNPSADLTVPALAKMVSMTEKTLSRTFKDRTGQTLGGFILSVRLGHACDLLLNSDRKIKDIARLSGLGSQANMRQLFITKLGQSPSKFRMKQIVPIDMFRKSDSMQDRPSGLSARTH